MKTGKFVWMFLPLMLGATTLLAQGWRNADRPGFGYGYNNGPAHCLNVLSDLTEEQQGKMIELETSHQEAMAELRVKQRSTFDPIEKNEIRGDMLKRVKAHRDEVRNLLTEDQQKQYDLLQTRNNYGGRGFVQGRRGGRGQAAFNGRRGRGPGGNCGYYMGGRGFRGGW